MKVNEKKWIRVRIYIVAFFFICGLAIIILRAYQLQVLEQDKLAAIARAGYKGKIRLPPKRGTIYDREGHELAVSVEVGSIYAHPVLVKKKFEAARNLSKILQISQSKTLALLKSKRSFVWIKRKISPARVKQVENLNIEGLGYATESRRYYPGREIAGHLIGFSGDDNQGLEGLEKSYNRMLQGPQLTLIQMRDALGRPFYISRPAYSGVEKHDLILTIDKDIQYRAQQSLKAVVEKFKAKSGQCVIVDPRTGEILAMAVVPQFDPNIFRKHRPEHWRNRTITDCFEPGSTMKAFLLAAALDRGIVSPQTRFDCEEGAMQVSNKVIHDTKPHGLLSVSEIIIKSSNIGAVKIGQKLGYQTFEHYLRSFGFGEKTGVDLIGERRGFIRDPKTARLIDKATIPGV